VIENSWGANDFAIFTHCSNCCRYKRIMIRKLSLLIALAAVAFTGLLPDTADARRKEQEAARAQLKSGGLMSIRQIEPKVKARMSGMEYLGFTFNASNQTYRLKFLEQNKQEKTSRVRHVYVNARSGAIIRVK